MYTRLLPPPNESFLLCGPRGSGKTSWTRGHFPQAHWIDFQDEALYQRCLADPSFLEGEMRDLPTGSWVVVDEVQRVPQVVREVERAIQDRGLRFALTASSVRKLRGAEGGLLGGRGVRRELYPLAPEELGKDFDLHRALRIGTLPRMWKSEDPDGAMAAYGRTYLKEEIQSEAVVKNLPAFARFLPIAARMHGQVLNVSGLAREAGVARMTVHDYLGVLEDTRIASLLPACEAGLRPRERRHPKLYFIDPGVVRGLKGATGNVIPEERGALFEGFVHTLLCLYRDTRGLCDGLSSWAPAEAEADEVDFVVSAGEARFAVDVKPTARVREEHLRGLRAIAGLPGLAARLLLHLGQEWVRTDDGIDILPFYSFAARLSRGSLRA